jgi:hypothetical protein
VVCPRCGKQNEVDARFCARCGIEMATILPPQPVEGEMFCYRHPKRATLLSCGHCGRPVCTDCVKLGTAGPRCPDCAKSNVAIRPTAVLFEAQRGFVNLVGPLFRSWYGWMILITLLGLIGRGCQMVVRPPRVQAPVQRNGPEPAERATD